MRHSERVQNRADPIGLGEVHRDHADGGAVIGQCGTFRWPEQLDQHGADSGRGPVFGHRGVRDDLHQPASASMGHMGADS